MSHDSENADRLLELAGMVLTKSASESDRVELNEILLTDEGSRRCYMDYCRMHVALRVELRAGNAVQTAYQQINLGAIGTQYDSPDTVKLAVSDAAVSPNLLHSTLTYLSSGWPVAYLIATVVLGIGAIVGSFTIVSQPTPVAVNSTPILTEGFMPAIGKIGQITAMIDCKWADRKTAAATRTVFLGETIALTSGLIEITYDTGAKVLLEGPVAYTVEGDNGGRLSLGKLTGRIDGKRAKGFCVRTPNATITDLGTEFGVEVGENRESQIHVFSGRVQYRSASTTDRVAPSIVLGEGESIVIRADGTATKRAVTESLAGTFIRRPPKVNEYVDLLDIIAGSDGSQSQRRGGINATNGVAESVFVSKTRTGDATYCRAADRPLIDGVFVPNGGTRSVQLDSAGHRFDGFPATDGTTLGSIWARDGLGRPDGKIQQRRHWICAIGPAYPYMTQRRGMMCLHPNAGITFNLEAIRTARRDGVPVRFHATAGMAGPGMADLWVFVDGQLRFHRKQLQKQDGPIDVGMVLAPSDRFLTLASTDGGDGSDYDWMVLGDPVLQVAPDGEAGKESR